MVFVCLSKPQKTSRLEGLRAQDTIRFTATALLAPKTATKVSHVRKSADHTEAVPEPSANPSDWNPRTAEEVSSPNGFLPPTEERDRGSVGGSGAAGERGPH